MSLPPISLPAGPLYTFLTGVSIELTYRPVSPTAIFQTIAQGKPVAPTPIKSSPVKLL
jgi:hypothetical protein